MTSNNSNNVNNANGGESGNGADGAIEGVAIEAAANFTGSKQRQAAVNDALWLTVRRAAGAWSPVPRLVGPMVAGLRQTTAVQTSMRGIVRLVWEIPNGLPGPGLLDAEPPDTARLGIGSRQLRAVPAMRRTVRCRGATARDRVRRGTRRMRRRRQ